MKQTASKLAIATYSRRPPALARHPAIKSAAALLFASVALLLVAASAMAAFSVFPVNVVPDCCGIYGASPITAGPDGNMWFGGQIEPGTRLESGRPIQVGDINAVVAKVTPSGAVTEYNIASGPYRGHAEIKTITQGPDGNLWFTGSIALPNGSVIPPGEPDSRDVIGKITTSGVITEYTIGTLGPGPMGAFSVSGTEASGITTGPDGNLWFAGARVSGSTVSHVGVIGKITTAGAVTEYTAGISARANGIAAGPDGNLWFTEESNKIGKITTAGAVTEYGVRGNFVSSTNAITQGPGHSMWFSVDGELVESAEKIQGLRPNNKVGKITMTGAVTEYHVKTDPGNVVVDSDGNVWATEPYCEQIVRMTTRGVVTVYGYGSGSAHCHPGALPQRFATGMARGADGNLWLTLRGRPSDIARFSTKSETKRATAHKRRSHKRGKKRH